MLWGMKSGTISERVTHIGVGGQADLLTTAGVSKEVVVDILTILRHNSER